ncbi:hypothetical protein TCAL_06967 [Tigriopus californicus]|uniref:PDZ domain-containing protein n=1 Tax=Tigriopus californicus TaxID=6832 RepID=A0A553PI29_TIGCA|nr:uncharacterized protein LOC131880280 [Tigriopus californicus]TRY77330.1 hypothetical protein TCAL_06967 [Tigriopus californicus]
MAYVNVTEWRAEQVADWLQGLDDSVYSYAHFFINNNVTGQGLLNLTVDDLYKLHVEKLGHQEIILEALELLKNLHYNLDTENLQYVCLRLSCKARSLWNEIRVAGYPQDKKTVPTEMMAACADVLDSLQVLISWLDRHPFRQNQHYTIFKWEMLKISIDLATSTNRDQFSERPIQVISDSCKSLADVSDRLIQDCKDSLFLQPAYLDVMTTKRKADETDFGVILCKHFSGAHLVRDIRFGSLAYQSGRIGIGDEIVQINYQTVVGWQLKKVKKIMEENPSSLILTLKKIPTESPVIGQIYIKPFRIPARQKNTKNIFNNLSSPRAELLTISSLNFPAIPRNILNTDPGLSSDEDRASPLNIVDTSDLEPDDPQSIVDPSESGKSPTQSIRSVISRLSRPRSAPQRRNTISGPSPSQEIPYINLREIWEHVNNRNNNTSNGSSAHSTMQSKDSGLSTMSSHLQGDSSLDMELRQKQGDPSSGRPVTVAAFNLQSQQRNRASYMNVPGKGSKSFELPATNTSLDSGFSQFPSDEQSQRIANRNPLPIPRVAGTPQIRKATPQKEPSLKKRPIPQPRKLPQNQAQSSPTRSSPSRKSSTGMDSSYGTDTSTPATPNSLSKSLRNFIPESVKGPPVLPVPTANFKSFKRVTPTPTPLTEGKTRAPTPQHRPTPPPTPSRGSSLQSPANPNLPEYVNTTPPVIPARAKPNNNHHPTDPTPPKKQTSSSRLQENIPLPTTAPPPRPQKSGSSSHDLNEPEAVLRQKSSSPHHNPSPSMFTQRHGLYCAPEVKPSPSRKISASNSGPEGSPGPQASDHYREGSPEKNWIDSLRRNQDEGKAVTSSPGNESPPRLPQRTAELRSAHTYQPLPQYMMSASKEEAHALRYAFDMDLGQDQRPPLPLPSGAMPNIRGLVRDRRFDSDDEHEYTRLSEMSSSPSSVAPSVSPGSHTNHASGRPGATPMIPTKPSTTTANDLPPLFNPSSYTIQDIKRNKKSH